MKKSIAVLGLGKYGMTLVKTLYEMGAEILAADRNEELVNEAAKYCTSSVCADLSNEENLQALGLKDMDIVVVAMAKNLEASIISVSVSKELEVPLIVAKSGSARMSSILEKIGADRVVIPEEYAGERWAKILISETILDFFEVDSSLCMIEMKPLEKWIGKSAKDLDLRQKNKINILAFKTGNTLWTMADPNQKLDVDTRLLVVMDRKTLDELTGME